MNTIARTLFRSAREPGITLVSVFSIAVGIAATVGVYSVIRGIVGAPSSPYLEAVGNVYRAPDWTRGFFTNDHFEFLRRTQRSFEHLAGWARVRADVAIDGIGRETLCEAVSGEYFHLFGVNPVRGRLLQPADDLPSAEPAVVISHALWSSRFNRDPDVIGRVVRLNGKPFEIVGVTPTWFRGVDMPTLIPTQAWIPLRARTSVLSAGRLTARPGPYLLIKGKLRRGVTFDQAAAEVRTIGRAFDLSEPGARSSGSELPAWQVIPAVQIRVHETVDSLVAPLAATAFLVTVVVLLVVSSNLANIQLARGAARRHEFAVKLALGASKGRVICEALTDVVLVGLLGVVCGLVAAHVFVTSILPRSFGQLNILAEPFAGMPLLVAFCAMLVAVGVGALVPAIQVTRLAPHATLSREDAIASTPRWRARRLLIVGQVSVAVMLVDTAAFTMAEMSSASPHSIRYSAATLAAVRLYADQPSAENRFTNESLDRITTFANIDGRPTGPLVMASALPGLVRAPDFRLIPSGGTSEASGGVTAVAGPFFDLIGANLRYGRFFTASDRAETESVIVLNETAARRLFGMTEVVGRRITVSSPSAEEPDEVGQRTITGVVGDLDRSDVRAEGFIPIDQSSHTTVLLAAHTGTTPDAHRHLERWSLGALRDVTVSSVGGTLTTRLNANLTAAIVLTAFLGAISFAVAIVGLSGFLAHLVIQRRREIGVRVALGACPRAIESLIVREGVQPVIAGILIGTAIAVAVQLGVGPSPYRGIDGAGAGAAVIVALSLFSASSLTAWLQARRAASFDVARTLKGV